MEIESDDSDRWEDIFGSSTELAPSVLGICDKYTLQNSFIHDASAAVKELEILGTQNLHLHTKSLSNSSNTSSALSNYSDHHFTAASTKQNGNFKQRHNIHVLSPNVQRLIAHSDVRSVNTLDIDAQHQQHRSQSSALRFGKKNPAAAAPHTPPANSTGGHRVKLSNIPLSKTTGKLTNLGSDLVETFSSSSEYLDALNYIPTEKPSKDTNITKPATPDVVPIDDNKTPTNNGTSFNFEGALSQPKRQSTKLMLPKSDLHESIKLIEMEQLATTMQLIAATSFIPSSSPKKFVATEPLATPSNLKETINFDFVSKQIEQLTLNDKEMTKSSPSLPNDELVVEAINRPVISQQLATKPLIPAKPSLTRSSSAVGTTTTTTMSPLVLANTRANTLGGPVPLKLPTVQQLEELEEASKMSAESLDRLMDIKTKFSPKESRKISGLMLPDIAKLKHRPLSSASICSTSSSSSSGSDQLNGKLAYLASVESLVDQSESELIGPHTRIDVRERSCMEIVDSERSYVEDLGQVIRGYLLDWKERACLRYDELRILFANIEEIYDFNSTLLKQLMNSGSGDELVPVKIAKCFIDMQDRFKVYTTYCTNHPEAMALLAKLEQATHTNTLLQSTQKMLQHTLPLGSYLLKPVQRILKYHLLLENLRKYYDIKEVFQAYEIMRQVAHNIDHVMYKLEQQSRIKELAGILDGWLGPDFKVLGELQHEGVLLENNKRRMVFFFTTMLIITKPKEDKRLQFKSYIHQKNLMLSESVPRDPLSFWVIPYDCPRKQIKLTAKDYAEKRLWTQLIKGAILENFGNIPNRAKELVYNLGNETDRTPDKHTWKWSLLTTSTPTYLERRNKYRRSELRNRTKRKTVATSSSFDSFNESLKVSSTPESSNATKPLTRSNTMSPATANVPAAEKDDCKCETDTNTKTCTTECKSAQNRRTFLRNSAKTPFFGSKSLKERSKSVPRISSTNEDDLKDQDRDSLHGSNPNLESGQHKSRKTVEVRKYNDKAIPKRIASLKKQRSSKRETSKFYMDLCEFEETTQTVLKITESTDNLIEKHSEGEAQSSTESTAQNIEESRSSTQSKKAKDEEIIYDILKIKEEFERIYKKPQKKRSLDNGISLPTSPVHEQEVPELPPRPPSRSPPPLESECESAKKIEEEEPIYESLLRNVHVPYKFSPVMGRSKSSPQHCQQREKKNIVLPRPESDYVTLVYSPNGILQKVGDELVQHAKQSQEQLRRDSSSSSSSSSSSTTLKRESQNTVINVECNLMSSPRIVPTNPLDHLLNAQGCRSSLENFCNSESSIFPRALKSIDNISLVFGRTNKPPERRVSDVTEMCRQSILHRQGSEAVGERMAHVDYADPKMLFGFTASEASLQRDSVFSLTSSNDSVCDRNRSMAASTELSTNFEYEDDVEACLENDFRDSAIYSDDNEKRADYELGSAIKRPTSPPPPPPPARNRSDSHPQLPPKPDKLKMLRLKSLGKYQPNSTTLSSSSSSASSATPTPTKDWPHYVECGGGVIICPPHLSAAASRSWVLQQIDNFSK